MCFFGSVIIFLGELSIQSLCPAFNWTINLVITSSSSVYKPFISSMSGEYIFILCGYPFHSEDIYLIISSFIHLLTFTYVGVFQRPKICVCVFVCVLMYVCVRLYVYVCVWFFKGEMCVCFYMCVLMCTYNFWGCLFAWKSKTPVLTLQAPLDFGFHFGFCLV